MHFDDKFIYIKNVGEGERVTTPAAKKSKSLNMVDFCYFSQELVEMS